MSSLLLQRPASGQAIAIAPSTNNQLTLDFATDSAELSRDGESLIFSFDNGSSIELTNFYSAYSSENMPEFVIEGVSIPGDAFFATLSEDLMPAAGVSTNAVGSGSNVDFAQASLLQGISALSSIDQENTQTITFDVDFPSIDTSVSTNGITQNSTVQGTQAGLQPTTQNISTSDSGNNNTQAPTGPSYNAMHDVLAADAGSTLTGNLLANDNISEGSLITAMEVPADWTSLENTDGSITFTSKDGLTTLTVHPDGVYELMTDISNIGMENLELGYTVTDSNGQSYLAMVTLGNSNSDNLFIETLEGGQAEVTNIDTNNSYMHEFTSYINDPTIGNQHVNGMLLGNGDDQLTVNNAIGSQTNMQYAGAGDTFIYGDKLDIHKQEDVGNDIINIGTLDGTKVRADGNLFNSIEGGDDTVNVDNMEFGSILGDGWTMHSNTKGGDDVINVGTMNAGEIYGEGKTQHSSSLGGNDTISVDTIDTTTNGGRTTIINGDGGDDVINVSEIFTNSQGRVTIDGGLGDDLFNYDNDADNTMALSGNNIYIKDVGSTNIINFEGIGSGAGDDLIKLYGTFDDIVVDGGEDMDILLSDFSNMSEIEDMIHNDMVSNTEFIVLNNGLNNASTTSTNDLLNKLENEGVTHKDGTMEFDSNWTQGTSIGDFDQFTNAAGDMTILVAKTQIENAYA